MTSMTRIRAPAKSVAVVRCGRGRALLVGSLNGESMTKSRLGTEPLARTGASAARAST